MRRGEKMSQELKDKLSILRKGKYLGSNNPHWRGGKIIVDGYVYIYSPEHPFRTKDGYVCEHRLQMEKKLGRYLKKGEVVHHLNHDRLDNRIKNLHLCPSAGRHFIDFHLVERDEYNRNFKRVIHSVEH